jgi:YihY family inner membrane protein
MNVFEKAIRGVDALQQRHRWLAFPFGVVKKFGDDQAGSLAALIAYYGFFSLFPLLLVFYSVLGLVLRGNPHLRQSLLDSALRDFPVIGTQIHNHINSISGNGTVLGLGIVGTLWAGLGVTQAAQNAMNRLWDVPRKDWPNFWISRARGLLLLGVLGTMTVVATFLSGVGTSSGTYSMAYRIGGIVLTLVLNIVLFALSYRVLTKRDLRWSDVLPGAIVAAVLWTLLQSLGGYYVTHQIKHASEVYGTFALVIGLLAWLYLGAQLTLLCAEINVVRKRKLWPRSLMQPPLVEADRQALVAAAKGEERLREETVEVSFGTGSEGPERAE